MLVLEQVSAGYTRPGRLGKITPICVIRDIDLQVNRGEIVALVGESGSGKTTLARTVVGLQAPFAGHVRFNGLDVHSLRGQALRAHRRRVQMVFQDPFASLSPRIHVGRAVAEPMEIHGIGTPASRAARVAELFDHVRLGAELRSRLPRDLSGGQRQRVAIARALALEPELLISDEPVTALDVSVQAKILNLLLDLRDELGIAHLVIAHDLAVVSRLADRVAVMHLGRIVEVAPTVTLFDAPQHPYTRTLLAAIPGRGDLRGGPSADE